MLMQNLLRFTDHLGRDARLIVNAFFQHENWSSAKPSRRKQNNTGVWKAHLLHTATNLCWTSHQPKIVASHGHHPRFGSITSVAFPCCASYFLFASVSSIAVGGQRCGVLFHGAVCVASIGWHAAGSRTFGASIGGSRRAGSADD